MGWARPSLYDANCLAEASQVAHGHSVGIVSAMEKETPLDERLSRAVCCTEGPVRHIKACEKAALPLRVGSPEEGSRPAASWLTPSLAGSAEEASTFFVAGVMNNQATFHFQKYSISVINHTTTLLICAA